jgi:hypothetical protein
MTSWVQALVLADWKSAVQLVMATAAMVARVPAR